MKCNGCKKDFDKNHLTLARNLEGNLPKSSKTYYCFPCEEQEFQRKILIEYLHQCFLANGYYNSSKAQANLDAKKRLMALVSTQIANLKKDGYSYIQIRLICDYMMNKENIPFSETILGLVPYYLVKTSRYHTELFRIGQGKIYGFIEPEKLTKLNTNIHKPNRKSLKITNMESL